MPKYVCSQTRYKNIHKFLQGTNREFQDNRKKNHKDNVKFSFYGFRVSVLEILLNCSFHTQYYPFLFFVIHQYCQNLIA